MTRPITVACQVEASADSGPRRRLRASDLRPGDEVLVRTASEIAATLDAQGRLRGCAFAEGMLASCGQRRRVLSRVERIFDEHERRMLRVHDVVYLEGSTCDGSARPGGCDAACYFAWRTEWLERPGVPARERTAPPTRDEPLGWRFRRVAREARVAIAHLRHGPGAAPVPAIAHLDPVELQPGDWVRVRSEDEVRSTLDSAGKLKGCTFTWAQYRLCGRTFRVLRRVERFYDVAQGRPLKVRNTVLLEGVTCDGSNLPETRGCDRRCHYFWRTEWLEKVPPPSGAP